MSTTANEIYVTANGFRERLDLSQDVRILPTFQANDRAKPESIQTDFSAEFEAPGTARNHRLLGHAAASQAATGAAYVRLPAVLTSGGVETLPLALLYVKGYKEGRYQLQLFAGNRRLLEALGEKTLQDLDLHRFDHLWTPANIAAGLPLAHWQTQGWGYEVYERGKPVNWPALNPYDLYPAVSGRLIWEQIIQQAGFTADSLASEPLLAALNVPTANPFTFPAAFRDARRLQAGFTYDPNQGRGPTIGLGHEEEFGAEQLPFVFTGLPPFHAPTAGTTFREGTCRIDTLGYYTLAASVPIRYGCRGEYYGQVSCDVRLRVNGRELLDPAGQLLGADGHRITSNKETDGGDGYFTRTFAPKLSRHLLQPGDEVTLWWQGDEWKTGPFNARPSDPYWQIGPTKNTATLALADGRALVADASFTVELEAEFPEGGLVRLPDWLPLGMKQIEYVKTVMLLLGLSIQTDPYTNHLRLAPGYSVLANAGRAVDWTAKRAGAAPAGRLPERDLLFRFGDYARRNALKWTQDEHVQLHYGDGQLLIADELLAAKENELAVLPFAASELSPLATGVLRLLNFLVADGKATPPTYTAVEAKPRLTLRLPDAAPRAGQLRTLPVAGAPAPVPLPFTTTVSTFAGTPAVSLLLNATVLTTYWADLRAMLDQARYLTEYYRLSAADIAALDYSVPVWDAELADFFAVSQIAEFDPRRATEVRLVRLNAAHLPAPTPPPAGGQEFFSGSGETAGEYYGGEYY